jgi:hypothetical protein
MQLGDEDDLRRAARRLAGVAGLLFLGARHSLRARPRPAPALLCISHAWSAATWWHGATLRLSFVQRGEPLLYGSPEFWVVAGAAVVMVAMFAVSLFLTYQADRRPAQSA